MKSLLAMVVLGMVCVGCALIPSPAKDLLDQADTKLATGDYSGAVALYTEIIDGYPNDEQAARARAVRTALERLRSAQTELSRAQSQSEELPRVRRDLSDRQSEVNQLRAEMAKLRADLERLRNIDLQDIKK